MNRFKRYLRRNTTLVETIIVLVGVITLFLGEVLAKDVVTGIGASIIASAIVVFMTDVFLGSDGDPEIKRWGLENVYSTRGEMNSSCDDYLKKAKYINVIAFGLKSMRDTQLRQVERILKKGGIIRIITMKPYCNSLKQQELDEFQQEDAISYSIEQLIAWAKKENNKNRKGRIEIRYHDHLPQNFLFMMDNRLFTGPYEYGKNSQQSISFEYNSMGAAYQYYKQLFWGLWDDVDFCQDALNE